ncbi:hypothetical protein QBZ16_000191 [Prototheca wickerhamii]|uniref:Inosine/uridine-preferring nucleoside hydrolase domain-containing protein n=1 Tax=Prototheca wickerhamii TaxID=3111 RepID=A0AAD9IMF1_PROWI|nr:hypothetical protein QBZ16_000191 [Prototheca wickerhamii]
MPHVPKIPVWLDCDPGHDDALAIILAGHSPLIELLGLSTVAGNQTVDKVTENAYRILYAAGLPGVEVVQGQGRPLLRPPLVCGEIHGESGLDAGPHNPRQTRGAPQAWRSWPPAWRRPSRRRRPGEPRVRVVATGALTNVALLLTLHPELIPALEVVFMGGALGTGNTAPVAEFNIQVDPEAAHIVTSCGVHTSMVPLEVTHTALVTEAVAEAVLGGPLAPRDSASPFRKTMYDLLHFFQSTYKEVFGFDNPPLHDPCAVAYVIAPELFKVSFLRVDVETRSDLSAGQTVTDLRKTTGRAPNTHVCLAMDVEGFWALMLSSLATADASSPLNQS